MRCCEFTNLIFVTWGGITKCRYPGIVIGVSLLHPLCFTG